MLKVSLPECEAYSKAIKKKKTKNNEKPRGPLAVICKWPFYERSQNINNNTDSSDHIIILTDPDTAKSHSK